MINIVAEKVSKDVIIVLIEDRKSQGKLRRTAVHVQPQDYNINAEQIDDSKIPLLRDTSENLAAQISELTESTERSSQSGRATANFNP